MSEAETWARVILHASMGTSERTRAGVVPLLPLERRPSVRKVLAEAADGELTYCGGFGILAKFADKSSLVVQDGRAFCLYGMSS